MPDERAINDFASKLPENDPMRRFLQGEGREQDGRSSRNVVHPRYIEKGITGKRAYYGCIVEIRGRNTTLNLEPQLIAFATLHTEILNPGEEDITDDKLSELLADKISSHYGGSVLLPPVLDEQGRKNKALREARGKEWDRAWNQAATLIRVKNQEDHQGNLALWDINGNPFTYSSALYTVPEADLRDTGL